MISEEVFNGVMAAIKAIKKLDAGQVITPGSQEHKDLIWAVLRLFDDNLLSKKPLSKTDIEWAQKIAEEYRLGQRSH